MAQMTPENFAKRFCCPECGGYLTAKGECLGFCRQGFTGPGPVPAGLLNADRQRTGNVTTSAQIGTLMEAFQDGADELLAERREREREREQDSKNATKQALYRVRQAQKKLEAAKVHEAILDLYHAMYRCGLDLGRLSDLETVKKATAIFAANADKAVRNG